MIITAQDMYQAVLDGIFKTKTGTLYPAEFDRLINRVQLEYIINKLQQEEENQKRTDDLRELRIITTNIAPNGPNSFPLPYTPSTSPYGYLYALAVNFKLNYVNNVCGLTGQSGYISAKTLKADWNQYQLGKDPYNKPSDAKLYYKIVGDNVIMINGNSQSTGAFMEIDYYGYAPDISVEASPNVNCVLAIHCRKEICDIAIRKYLEETGDPGYQTKSLETKVEIV
jgi:hypothetical protein